MKRKNALVVDYFQMRLTSCQQSNISQCDVDVKILRVVANQSMVYKYVRSSFLTNSSANFINFRGRGKYSAHSPSKFFFSLTALHDQSSFIHRSHVSYVSFFTSRFLGVLKTLNASCYETAKQNT